MNAQLFAELVSKIKVGKHLPEAIYLHKDAFSALPKPLRSFIPAVAKAVSLDDEKWNLVKLFKKDFRISLLSYPTFYQDSYPALHHSMNVDLSKLKHKITSYEQAENPPILHRKETMVLPDNPHYQKFIDITQEGENAGLYENTRTIGFKKNWEKLIQSKGFTLVDGRLFRSSAVIKPQGGDSIDRHKTALVRYGLSAPMKLLSKHGYLNGEYSIFDYGCGRQDDLTELNAHGLDATGWDPNFAPDNDKCESDIVNLGFVLNVIEDQEERLEALIGAWDLTQKLLVVSVMIANDEYIRQFKPYKDGIITSINTFQKYYAQAEIKGYLERSLQEEPIAIAPGIFYIFKDKIEEQQYLQNKYKRHHKWEQRTSPIRLDTKEKLQLVVAQNEILFRNFWNKCLELGRVPANDEFNDTHKVKELIGSNKKVFELLRETYPFDEYEKYQLAVSNRMEDILLYLSMELFEKRRPYIKQPDSFKRDIKAFFDGYQHAREAAKSLLFSIVDTEQIEQECIKAHNTLPASILNEGHSLIFHKDYVDQLPLLLRIYLGAALQMYGEIDDDINLIKIHIQSGKLTLASYDDFEKSVPMLVERIKIKMADQDIDFFDYVDENKRPPLLNKHLFLAESNVQYKKQLSFDKRLSNLLDFDINSEKMLSSQELNYALNTKAKKISGFKIISCIKV